MKQSNCFSDLRILLEPLIPIITNWIFVGIVCVINIVILTKTLLAVTDNAKKNNLVTEYGSKERQDRKDFLWIWGMVTIIIDIITVIVNFV